jgi:hypothetical protein
LVGQVLEYDSNRIIRISKEIKGIGQPAGPAPQYKLQLSIVSPKSINVIDSKTIMRD